MIIKKNVQIAGLNPVMQIAINACRNVIEERYNGTFMVTSAVRGPDYNKLIGGHPKSKHLTGEAIDISKRLLQPGTIPNVVHTLRKVLEKKGFQVINENTHIHIQYDPSIIIYSTHLPSEEG